MDLIQDASVNAYRAFHQFQAGTNFRAWFLKILTNLYYRQRQVDARSALVSLEEAPELFLYLKAKKLGISMEGDPVEALLGGEDEDAVCKALARLPEDYRVVATLHFLSEASYQECAETLDVPIGTIRSRLHRARKLLQVALWQIGEERGYVPAEETR